MKFKTIIIFTLDDLCLFFNWNKSIVGHGFWKPKFHLNW